MIGSALYQPEQIEALRRALAALPPGTWEVWTSCSFRRITALVDGRHGQDGGVLCGQVQRDGHPDLSMNEWHGQFPREGVSADWVTDARGFLWRTSELPRVGAHLGPFTPVSVVADESLQHERGSDG